MPATSGLPAIGAEIAGKYRIESVLGLGGMGAVFSAQNALTGKRVAIKWLLPEQASETSRERLLREARIAASIEHPNVVDIYDIGEHEGGLFLVMEYLRGQTLGDILVERGRLDPDELIGLLIPIMRGVHFAHQCGVVHRDLKPENIILSEVNGQIVPKVLDFGVSKSIGSASLPHSTLTRTGALVGTPHYMALEQVDGSGAVDGRTDVYAFGIILYRALTGQYPFDGSSLGEVILKIGTKDPPSMREFRPELTPELDAAVLRAIARPRHERYPSVEELARALEPFSPGVRFRESGDAPAWLTLSSSQRYLGPVPFAPVTSSERSGPGLSPAATAPTPIPARRRGWVVAAVASLCVLVLVAGLAAWLRPKPKYARVPIAVRVPVVGAIGRVRQSPTVPALAEMPIEQGKVSDGAHTLGDVPLSTVAVKPSTLPRKPAIAAKGKRKAEKQQRTQGPNVVPGDRTRGLSADDF